MDFDGPYQYSEEATGNPDKPYRGRFRGTWVASAATELEIRRELFRFHNRRLNPVRPHLTYLVRTPHGEIHYASSDLDECERMADQLGSGAFVVPLVEVEHEVVEPGTEILYRVADVWVPPAGFTPEPPAGTTTRTWCPVCGLMDQVDGHTLRMKRCPGVVRAVRYHIVDENWHV